MTLPAMTASHTLSPGRDYQGMEHLCLDTTVEPAFSLMDCISGCAPAAIDCIDKCGTNVSCWLKCGGSAAVTCLLACL